MKINARPVFRRTGRLPVLWGGLIQLQRGYLTGDIRVIACWQQMQMKMHAICVGKPKQARLRQLQYREYFRRVYGKGGLTGQ